MNVIVFHIVKGKSGLYKDKKGKLYKSPVKHNTVFHCKAFRISVSETVTVVWKGLKLGEALFRTDYQSDVTSINFDKNSVNTNFSHRV